MKYENHTDFSDKSSIALEFLSPHFSRIEFISSRSMLCRFIFFQPVALIMRMYYTKPKNRSIQSDGFKVNLEMKIHFIHLEAGFKIKNYFLKMMKSKTFF